MTFGRMRRSRFSVRLMLALVLALLCQHAAIAAYACPVDPVSVKVMKAMPDCSSMAERAPPALCEKHCNPDESAFAGPYSANVPPAVLPPLRFGLARVLPVGPATHACSRVPLTRSDPPPTLRFCSLLI